MTETTEPTICPECAWGGGFHAPTCSRQFVLPRNVIPEKPFYAPNPDCQPDREAEYRHIWISRAAHAFDSFVHPASDPVADAELAFKIADAFIAELRKRDGEGE